jgi:hypothetical protein
MRTLKKITWCALFSLLVLVINCGTENLTQPELPLPDYSDLLVSSLSVALVQHATQTVCVDACDKQGNPEGFTVTSGNTGVASVVTSDTTFTVSGENYGSTTIEVTSNSGKTTTIPATVYNPQVLETDELLITYVQTFHPPWYCNSNDPPTAFAWPLVTDGFRALGPMCYKGGYNPDGVHAVMVVKAKPGSDVLAPPTDYELLWGADPTYDVGAFWMPVPPVGYKAMGVVAWQGYEKPFLDAVACVREDLTMMGEAADDVIDGLVNFPYYLYLWKTESPVAGPHENAYFSTGTFVCTQEHIPPSVGPAMNVLNSTIRSTAATRCGESRTPRSTGSNDRCSTSSCITTTTRLP